MKFPLMAVVLSFLIVGLQPATAQERPNILLIMVDDLDDSIEGFSSQPVAITPNINRLREKGVFFTNAHANSPVCAPSRNSLFSGLYPHTTGAYNFVRWNDNDTLAQSTELVQHFRSQGYVTIGTGKVHHGGGGRTGSWSTIDGERQFQAHHDPGPWPWDGDPDTDRTIHPDMAYLFDHTDGLNTQARLTGSSSRFLSFGALSNVPRYPASEETGVPGYTGWRRRGGSPFRYVSDTDRDLMPDEQKAQYVVEALARDYDRPFFIAVGFNRPHEPLYVPDEYLDRYPLEGIQLPPMLANDWDDLDMIPETSRGYAFDRFEMYWRAGGEALLRQFIQAYLASVSIVDDQVGAILDALEQSPYADNTIVMFVSDHGYHLGEKGAVYKATLWDEATRVPFIIVAPGVAQQGGVSNHPVTLVDIYPTLIELAGLNHAESPAQSLDGHSVRPFLVDPDDGEWGGPAYALSTIYGSDNQSSQDWTDHNFSLRGERWRYTRYSNGGEELYDMQADPHAWRNLAGTDEYSDVLAQFRAQLLSILERDDG